MSNISDEKLVVAAVKGDDQAIELLKERLKPKIRNIIKKSPIHPKENMKAIEAHVLENVVNSLDAYRFKGDFQGWVRIRIRNKIIDHIRKQSNAVNPDPDTFQSIAPLWKPGANLNTTWDSGKHPPLEQIDIEIRSLVSLLNQSSYIRTISSCSGHPNRKEWGTHRRWDSRYGGWISFVPTGNPHHALELLIGVLERLDNTGHSTQQGEDISDNTICQRYRQVDADILFCAGVPIVIARVIFRFYVCHSEEKHRLEIYKQFIACAKELTLENKELAAKVDTPEMAAQILQKTLQQEPFLFSVRLGKSQEGYPGISLSKYSDLTSCQWFSTLVNRLHERLDEAGYMDASDAAENAPFAEEWYFSLQPFLNQEGIQGIRVPYLMSPQWKPRTYEDHLKIWQLLELAVAEQIKCEV
ncbi:MAG: hypothetical protein OXI43_02615 [Candidatus Poribacteria bacterium]|nr:hypothetical protein [Candidatus Poribacteria bacterium]